MFIRDDKHYTQFLYAGFGLLLVTFIFLAVYYFQQIVHINKVLTREIDNNSVQLHAAMTMRVAVREHAILLWQMTFQEDILSATSFPRNSIYLEPGFCRLTMLI